MEFPIAHRQALRFAAHEHAARTRMFAMNARQLSLVIPAYNEELSLRQAIEEAEADLPHVARDFEILVVDDGSSDDTPRVARACAIACPHVRLLQHTEN